MLGFGAVSEAAVSDLGTTVGSVQVAYTEPADAVAIFIDVGGDLVNLAVAYVEPPDIFAIYGPPAPPPVREQTYTRRPLGYSFEPSITVIKDRPGPLRIIEFSGWMN